MIPRDVIDSLINRVSIVDVIGRVTEVKKSGRNFIALCPFHNEKTPSFSISEEKGLYHCFGCGASGNTIKFLMEYYRLDFMEALEKLADMAGVDLSQYKKHFQREQIGEKKILYEIQREALTYFHNKLLQSDEALIARNYLKERNISHEMIKYFKLGYAGKENNLYNYLTSRGYKGEMIIKLGLCINGNDGIYDRFRDRLLFPIFDRDGNPVGFGGRILEDRKDIAKYINSPDSSIFHKGELLFAFNYSKDEIDKQKVVYVVEGYMDVIALFQNGIKNVVAPLGTSITESQISMLKRYSDRIVFIFDGDEAGIKAANRAIDIASNMGVKTKVVILPDNMDPYDFSMKYGRLNTLQYFEEKQLEAIDFKLKFFSKRFSLTEDKVNFARSIFGYVRNINSAIEREEALKKTAGVLGESFETILIEYQNYLKKENTFGRLIDNKTTVNKKTDLEVEFLGGLLNYPDRINELFEIVLPEMFFNEKVRNILEKIKDNNDEREIKNFIFELEDGEIVDAVSRMALDEKLNFETVLEKAYSIRHRAMKKKLGETKDIKEISKIKGELFEIEEILHSFATVSNH
ncbi:MAG: DNA primase [Brevinematia bacterium]